MSKELSPQDVWKQTQGKALFHLEDTQSALDLIAQMNQMIIDGKVDESFATFFLEETIRHYTNLPLTHE